MADAWPLLHATGGLVRARRENDGTHRAPQGLFLGPPTMVIASRSLPRYNHPLIRCFVTLAPTATEMGVLYVLGERLSLHIWRPAFPSELRKLPLRTRARMPLIKSNVPSSEIRAELFSRSSHGSVWNFDCLLQAIVAMAARER